MKGQTGSAPSRPRRRLAAPWLALLLVATSSCARARLASTLRDNPAAGNGGQGGEAPDTEGQGGAGKDAQGGAGQAGKDGQGAGGSAGQGSAAGEAGAAHATGGAGPAFGGAAGASQGGTSGAGQGGTSGGTSAGGPAFGGAAGAANAGQGGSGQGGSGQGGSGQGGVGTSGASGQSNQAGASGQQGEAGASGQAGEGGAGAAGQGSATPEGALVLGDTPDTTTQRLFEQGPSQALRLVSGGPPCKLSAPPFSTQTHFTHAQVYNPGPKAAKVELGVGAAKADEPLEMTLMAAYASLPTTDSERLGCLTGAEVSCSLDVPIYETCLGGDKAVEVPAGGSIWVYVGNFSADTPPASFYLFARVLYLL